jgi:hypothetical protein
MTNELDDYLTYTARESLRYSNMLVVKAGIGYIIH